MTADERNRIRAAIDYRRRTRELIQLPDGTWRKVLPASFGVVILPDPSPAAMWSPGTEHGQAKAAVTRAARYGAGFGTGAA